MSNAVFPPPPSQVYAAGGKFHPLMTTEVEQWKKDNPGAMLFVKASYKGQKEKES